MLVDGVFPMDYTDSMTLFQTQLRAWLAAASPHPIVTGIMFDKRDPALVKQQILDADRRILAWHRASEVSRRLDDIPGVGPLIATALVASVPDPHAFRSGRDLAAWIGLVPRQNSTGGVSPVVDRASPPPTDHDIGGSRWPRTQTTAAST